MSNPEIKTRMVEQQYITLMDPGWSPHVREGFKSMFSPTPACDVTIPVSQLYEFYEYSADNDKYFDSAFHEFSSSQERALVEQGWATLATRGGVWATESLQKWIEAI